MDFFGGSFEKMGFSIKWVELLMECVRLVSYSILVNGQAVRNIKPSRGIRQGDPLSLYLFIICAEALSSLINQAVQNGVITGVSTSKSGPQLSHLFFADDSLLFCKANSVEWRRLLRILDIYEAASGLKLNMEKTSIFFSRNTSEAKREEISQLLGLQATQSYEKYLGLPTLMGKSRVKSFQSIKDKVWKCLQNWKNNFLSQVGKEVLLKAVVQAIPTFCMSVFLLPISLFKETQGMMQRFWWVHKDNTSKIHWVSWEQMGKARMGFQELTSSIKHYLPNKFGDFFKIQIHWLGEL